MITRIYRNKNAFAVVVMDGECLGLHCKGKTCVRKTTDNRYAVISTESDRLIAVKDDPLHARRFNFAIHGEKL